MAEIEPRHLEYLAAHRLAVSEPRLFHDLGERPAVSVWPYRQDGICDGALWGGLPEKVSAGVRPATEPPDRVEAARRALGLPPGQPVYVVMQPGLRVWCQDDQWFVDDSQLPLGGRRHRTFVWWFTRFEDTVEAVLRFYHERLGVVCSAEPSAAGRGGL